MEVLFLYYIYSSFYNPAESRFYNSIRVSQQVSHDTVRLLMCQISIKSCALAFDFRINTKSDQGGAKTSQSVSCTQLYCGSTKCCTVTSALSKNQVTTCACLCVKPAHLRVAQEIVELDLADGGVGLEIGELVSQQKSRHDRLFSAAHTHTHWREEEGTNSLRGLKRSPPHE